MGQPAEAMRGSTSASILEQFLAKARRVLKDEAQGPLLLAEDITKLAARWDDDFRDEVGDIGFTPWLKSALGPGKHFGYWNRRANAVERIGKTWIKYMHHEVACYISEHVPDDKLKAACIALQNAYVANSNNPVEPGIGRQKIIAATGVRVIAKKPPCADCRRLRELLTKNGIEIPKGIVRVK